MQEDMLVQQPADGGVGLSRLMDEFKAAADVVIEEARNDSTKPKFERFMHAAEEIIGLMLEVFGPANAWLYNERGYKLHKLAQALEVEEELEEQWLERVSSEHIEFHRSCYMLTHTLQVTLPPEFTVKIDRRPSAPTKWRGIWRRYEMTVHAKDGGESLRLLCAPIANLNTPQIGTNERPVGFYNSALLIAQGSSEQWEKEALFTEVSRPLFGSPSDCVQQHDASAFLRGDQGEVVYRSCNELVFLTLSHKPTVEELGGDPGSLVNRLLDLDQLRQAIERSRGLVLTFPAGMTLFFPL